jgi:hypothetical protein
MSIQALVRHGVADVTPVRGGDPGHSPLFCQGFPTAACAAGNGGVRSLRDGIVSLAGEPG